jgi:hypothetical protein
MANRSAIPNGGSRRVARCVCGLTFPGPWELIGHFLAVYPPNVDEPLDDVTHADVTRLATKLAEGPTEAWEFGTWARDPRKHLRVAASIAMRAATGDLGPWAEITHQQVRDTYGVSAYAVTRAMSDLRAAGIIGNYGGRNNVTSRDLIRKRNAHDRTGRILDLITIHVMNLEAELSALKNQGVQQH